MKTEKWIGQQLKIDTGDVWYRTFDGDPYVFQLFKRHYTYREYKDGRKQIYFVGPGEKEVLVNQDGTALFVWRKFISDNGQNGVNCAVFRNESTVRSSTLILAAEVIAWNRWPNERLYTYVNSHKIKSSNPGYCFKMAGWIKCGITKINKLTILEKLPLPFPQKD